MWKVYTIDEAGRETLIYRGRWMPTIDNMEIVGKVRGKKYKVLTPDNKDVTHSFRYGTPT